LELVVDANILLASFLKEAITRELLLDARLTLFAPEYLISETSRHLKKNAPLRKRISLSNDELQELLIFLTSRITTIPSKTYSREFKEALNLAPHKEDAPYLALALSMQIPIWSNDKGLKIQSKVKVYSTSELITFLGKMRE
jgi:predicted nucleic acid-binding protein